MRLLPLSFVVLAVLFAGCATGTTMTTAPTSDAARDSLRAENVRLSDQIRALRDSLRTRDDIETGQYDRNLRTIQDQLTRLSYQARLLRDGGLTVAQVSTDLLFASADSISAAGRARLDSIATHLRRAYPDRTIRVEGHADDRPLGGDLKQRFPSNWELSAARATAVVRALIERTSFERDQFVAVGYGDTRPRASNETPRGRQRNRRVRIAVLPQPRTYSRPFEDAW